MRLLTILKNDWCLENPYGIHFGWPYYCLHCGLDLNGIFLNSVKIYFGGPGCHDCIDGIANLNLEGRWMALKVTQAKQRQLTGESHNEWQSASKPSWSAQYQLLLVHQCGYMDFHNFNLTEKSFLVGLSVWNFLYKVSGYLFVCMQKEMSRWPIFHSDQDLADYNRLQNKVKNY